MGLADARPMTVAEYLAFERESEGRHEYIDGTVVAKSGGSREHNRIAGNILATLHAQTRRHTRCRPYVTDMRLRVADSGLYAYPDLFVTCGEERTEEDGLMLLDATLLLEVLSPSTETYDRGEKWARYRQLPSLRDYLLISQDRVRVERYERIVDGGKDRWIFTVTDQLDAVLELRCIDSRLALADVYDDVFADSRTETAS